MLRIAILCKPVLANGGTAHLSGRRTHSLLSCCLFVPPPLILYCYVNRKGSFRYVFTTHLGHPHLQNDHLVLYLLAYCLNTTFYYDNILLYDTVF